MAFPESNRTFSSLWHPQECHKTPLSAARRRYAPLIKHSNTISLLSAFLLLASIAMAQTGDWEAVQHLPGGTMLKITLKRGHTFGHCEFMGATDDALHCDSPGLRYIRAQYPRDNIKAVYLVHNARAIGVGIGAGAGAVIGAPAIRSPALVEAERHWSMLPFLVAWAIFSAWRPTRSFMAKPYIAAPTRRRMPIILLPRIRKGRASPRTICRALRTA